MLIDRITVMLDTLDGRELERMRPADRRKFAALCHHWWQLAEAREKAKAGPRAGVVGQLNGGDRSE
ncbi:MAG TPA: hypothetical protein VGF29_01305 [Hyphomicrobiaceae bacterium]